MTYLPGCSPTIACGRSTPPLPIAIQCISMTEAKRIHNMLQPVITNLPPDPGSMDLIAAFSQSSAIHNLFSVDSTDFYSVAIGVSPGIHRTRYVNIILRSFISFDDSEARASALRSQGSYTHYSWRVTRSFWEALAFMIVKGIEEHMPLLLTLTELTNGWVCFYFRE